MVIRETIGTHTYGRHWPRITTRSASRRASLHGCNHGTIKFLPSLGCYSDLLEHVKLAFNFQQ